MSNSYFNELRDKKLAEEATKKKEPFIELLESIWPFSLTKDIEAPYSETLNYTPADTQPLLEKFRSKDNSGWGFQKTVTQEYEDFQGRGPGTLYLSDKKGVPTFTFYPSAPKEWMAEQNKKIAQLGFIANAPLNLAPFAMVAGVKNRGYVPQHIVMKGSSKYPNQQIKIPLTSKGLSDAKITANRLKLLDNEINSVWNRSPTEVQIINQFARKHGIGIVNAEKYLDHFTPYGILKDTDKDSGQDSVYFTDDELAELGMSSKSFGIKPLLMTDPTDKSKYQPPENFSGITPPTFDQARQKINRAIGNDVYVRHDDGIPRFDFVQLQNNKVFTSEYKRLIGSDISTIDEFGLPFAKLKRNVQYPSRKAAFNNLRKQLLVQYEEWYGPAMKRLNISSSDIDLDHRLTLIQSLGIYHNVDPKSQLWIDIQNIAVKRGLYPGDAERNLDLADPESHRVKSNYFNDLHGLKTHNNMKYWNGQHRNLVDKDGQPISRLQVMEQSHLGPEYEKAHLEVVNDYFDVVERGNIILDSAKAIWHAENMKGILPEEIVETLMEVSIDKRYNVKQMENQVKAMMDVELNNYKKIQRLFEIEEELDLINSSPETILDTDPIEVKNLKKEWKKINTVRKSPWFKNHYKKMMGIREDELSDPQRNIFELLGNTPITEERFLEILKEYGISDD